MNFEEAPLIMGAYPPAPFETFEFPLPPANIFKLGGGGRSRYRRRRRCRPRATDSEKRKKRREEKREGKKCRQKNKEQSDEKPILSLGRPCRFTGLID